jgi:hypothetical protein
MILALGAMILLTLLITNVNKSSLSTEGTMYDSNFGITATSIASSIIEDASKLRFDQTFYVDSSTVYDPTSFTPAIDLGPETGSGEVADSPRTFNDFDDYNNYSGVDSTMPTAVFNFSCSVCYVNDNALDSSTNTQTYYKKITVRVWSPFMKDTIVISSIYSYWNFLP